VREGVDRRLRQAEADAGDLKPASGIGSSSLWRRERVFIVGAEVLCKLHGRDPVSCSRVSRGQWRGDAGLGVCSRRGLEVGSAAGGAGRSSLLVATSIARRYLLLHERSNYKKKKCNLQAKLLGRT
jgi:hypothetical protein